MSGHVGSNTASIVEGIVKLMAFMSLQDTFWLGFLAYSSLVSASFDGNLFKRLFRRPNLTTLTGGLTYFVSRLLGHSYFSSSLMISMPFSDCSVVTRYVQVMFYLLRLLNMGLFVWTLLVAWRRHRQFPIIVLYVVLGMALILGLSIACIIDGKLGIKMRKPIGCVYILNDRTLPRKSLSIIHALVCLLFQVTSMILTGMRTLSRAVISNRIGLARLEPLMRQGFHYWIISILFSFVCIFIPVSSLRDYPLIIVTGMISFTAMDIELGGRLFRLIFADIEEKSKQVQMEMVPPLRPTADRAFVENQPRFDVEFESKDSVDSFASASREPTTMTNLQHISRLSDNSPSQHNRNEQHTALPLPGHSTYPGPSPFNAWKAQDL